MTSTDSRQKRAKFSAQSLPEAYIASYIVTIENVDSLSLIF